jgi:hypothetical protein
MTEYLDKWDGDIIRALRFQDEEICELAADEITTLRAEVLEEAARECGLSSVGLHFAAAIRALKGDNNDV